jgi:site-specific recombinase XerC
VKRYLTPTEQHRILRAARNSSDPLARRDFHWMRLLMNTGARIAEFAQFTVEQAEMALASGYLVALPQQRKGGKRAHEYLVTASVREDLQALLAMQRAIAPAGATGEAQALVPGREDGRPLSVRSYQARLQQWAVEAGLPFKVSPHWLRHTRGMNVLRASRSASPLQVVQQALGHASITSTTVYASMAREEVERDLHAADGRRTPKRAALLQALARAEPAGRAAAAAAWR